MNKKIQTFAVLTIFFLVAFNTQSSGNSSKTYIIFLSNNPPFEPHNPKPMNGKTGLASFSGLSWMSGDPDGDNVTYDIYLGKNNPPPLVCEDYTSTLYEPGVMNYSTKYYWKIIAWDEHGASTEGPIWSFTTLGNLPPFKPRNPKPMNGSMNVEIDYSLYWTGGDPNYYDIVTYDVYFGTSSPPPLVAEDISEETYDQGIMEIKTTYNWQIVSEDSQGLTTSGPVWWFTTEYYMNEPPSSPEIKIHKGFPIGTVNLTIKSIDPDGDDIFYNIY